MKEDGYKVFNGNVTLRKSLQFITSVSKDKSDEVKLALFPCSFKCSWYCLPMCNLAVYFMYRCSGHFIVPNFNHTCFGEVMVQVYPVCHSCKTGIKHRLDTDCCTTFKKTYIVMSCDTCVNRKH